MLFYSVIASKVNAKEPQLFSHCFSLGGDWPG